MLCSIKSDTKYKFNENSTIHKHQNTSRWGGGHTCTRTDADKEGEGEERCTLISPVHTFIKSEASTEIML